MSKKSFVWRGLAALVLIGLLIVGGLAVHYVAWSRGYAAGQLAAEGEEAATLPYLLHGYGFAPYRFGGGLLPTIGLLLLFLVFIGVIGKLVRFVFWGAAFHPMMAGPWARNWHRKAYRHWAHGPVPPWSWDWGESPEEAGDAEPES
jgi:hypothetical protein